MARPQWSAEERLVAEQAVALRHQVMKAMENAPFGQGLAVTEAAVLDGGRAFLQKMLQGALSARPEAQKGGSAREPATAEKTPRSKRILRKPLITAAGDVRITRRYYRCRHCRTTQTPWDDWAGLGSDHLTPHVRRVVVLSGSSWSF